MAGHFICRGRTVYAYYVLTAIFRHKLRKKGLAETSARPIFSMVPKAGLEPARRVTTLDFESSASANSATSALVAD